MKRRREGKGRGEGREGGARIVSWNVEGWKQNGDHVRNWRRSGDADLWLLSETWQIRNPGFLGKHWAMGKAEEGKGRPKAGFFEFTNETSQFNFKLDERTQPGRIREVTMSYDKHTIHILHVYGPQAINEQEVNEFYGNLNRRLVALKDRDYLILGDFNARLGEQKTNKATSNLQDFILRNKLLRQTPKYLGGIPATCLGITKGTSVVDHLLLCEKPSFQTYNFESWFQGGAKSHHAVMSFNINWEGIKKLPHPYPPAPINVWTGLNKKQWEEYELENQGIRESMKNLPFNTIATKTIWWTSFTKKLTEARNKIAPAIKMGGKRTGKKGKPKGKTGHSWRADLWKRIARGSMEVEELENLERLVKENEEKESLETQMEIGNILEVLIDKLNQAVESDPTKMWDILRAMKQKKQNNLPSFLKKDDQSRTKHKQEYLNEWWKALGRKGEPPVTGEGGKWRKRVKKEVKKLRDQRNKGTFGEDRPTKPEIKKALQKSKKDGAPGGDNATIEMFLNGGEEVLDLLYIFFGKVWEDEEVPDQFIEDIIVPIFKKGYWYDASNWRPISLMATMAKTLQRIVYDRIDKWAKIHLGNNGAAGARNYGGCKGRDRLTLIWLIEAMAVAEFISEENGGILFACLGDVKGAYPGAFQEGISWVYNKLGITGKIWRISCLLEENLKGRLRLNGRLTKFQKHNHGMNQGSISAVHRWNIQASCFFRFAEKKGMGVLVGGTKLQGFGFVDDVTNMTNSYEKVAQWLVDRRELKNQGILNGPTLKTKYLSEKRILKRERRGFGRTKTEPLRRFRKHRSWGKFLQKHLLAPHRKLKKL